MYWILVFTTKKDPPVENVQSVPLSKIKPLRFKEKKIPPWTTSLPDTTATQGLKGLLFPLQTRAQNKRRWRGLLPSPPPSRRGHQHSPPSCTWSISVKATRHVFQTLAFSSCSCCPGDFSSLGSGSQSEELLWVSMWETASEFNFLLFFNWCKWDLDFICAEKTKTK